jgi:hypothetical protein
VSEKPKADSGSDQFTKPDGLLTLTEVPFLATVFIGLLCWSVTYFSDAMKKSPTVCYRKINDNGDCFYLYPAPPRTGVVEYEIKNLTRDQVFKDVSFYIMATKGTLRDPKVIPIAPAKISSRSPTAPEIQAGTFAQYRLPEFHPDWRFRLRVRLTGGTPKDTRIIFDYTNRFALGWEQKVEVAPVRLIEASLETWIVENDFRIIAMIFLISFIAIVWYIVRGMKNQ